MTGEELAALIRAEIERDSRLQTIRQRIRDGKADFSDSERYAEIEAEITGRVMRNNVLTLEDRQASYVAATRERHKDIFGVFSEVQEQKDAKDGVRIKPQEPPFDEKRAGKIGHALEDKTVPDETIQRRAESATETFIRSQHDDCMKYNAEFRDRAGMTSYIIRDGSAKCCDWCADVSGKFTLDSAPSGIWGRHDNCKCSIQYDAKKGGRQLLRGTSKKWEVAPGAGAGALHRLSGTEGEAVGAGAVHRMTPGEVVNNPLHILTNGAEHGRMNTNDESDFFHRIVNVVTGKAYLNAISDFEEKISLCEREDVRALLTAAHKSVQYAKSDSNRSKFNHKKNTVYLADTTITSTVAHELFHKIDHDNNISASRRLTGCIQSDYTELMRRASEKRQNLQEMFSALYPDAFVAHGILAEEYRGVSDIISGMTNGSVFLGYKHDKDYWKRPLALEKETFAQYGRMLFESNPEVIVFLKEMFPETTKEVDRIISEISKQGE